MDFNISIKNLKKTLKLDNIKLTSEEKSVINTIWSNVDLYDEGGDYKAKGDGKLNANEWVRFKTELQKISEELYSKLSNFIKDTNSTIEYTSMDYYNPDEVFDAEMFTKEALVKRYPAKHFTIEEKDENGLKSIIITNKKGNEVLKIERDSFGNSKITTRMNCDIKRGYIYDADNRIIREEIYNKRYEDLYDTKVVAKYNNDSNLKFEDNCVYDILTGRLVSKKTEDKETIFNEDGSYEEIDLKTGIKTYYDKNKEIVKSELCQRGFDAALQYASLEESADKYNALIDRLLECEDIYDVLMSHRSINNLTSYLDELKIDPNEVYEQDIEMANNLSKKILDKLLSDAEKRGVYTEDLKESFNEIYNSDETLYSKTYEIKRLIARVEGNESKPFSIKPNGKIEKDSEFSQGIVGNCWLIADLKSIINSNNDKALAKLNELITVQTDEEGNIISETVTIQGKEYVIPIEEINGADELSSGDFDVRAIELAVYKYLDEINMDNRAIGTGLTNEDYFYDTNPGGSPGLGLDILFGNGGEKIRNNCYLVNSSTIDINEDFISKIQNEEGLLATAGTNEPGFYAKNTSTNETIEIAPDHAYTILKIDNNMVYLQNPMDLHSDVLEMSLLDFRNCFKQGNLYAMN